MTKQGTQLCAQSAGQTKARHTRWAGVTEAVSDSTAVAFRELLPVAFGRVSRKPVHMSLKGHQRPLLSSHRPGAGPPFPSDEWRAAADGPLSFLKLDTKWICKSAKECCSSH